jgi:hypothetical protein
MNTDFRISLERRNNDLHIKPAGVLDGNSVWQLINVLHEQFTGNCRIYIDTNDLGEICSFGVRTFQCRLDPGRIPFEHITFTGEKASKLAPEGCRIVPHTCHTPSCRCNGKCKVCKCTRENSPSLSEISTVPPVELIKTSAECRTERQAASINREPCHETI